MDLFQRAAESGVGVWHYQRQCFILHIACPGEKRVRIDVHDSLANYGVYKGTWSGQQFTPSLPIVPLDDWRIDLS